MPKGTNGYNGGPKVGDRMYALLKDGEPHSVKELRGCLYDDMSGANAVAEQISQLRKTLRPLGQDIYCLTIGRVSHYRLVRRLASAVDGKR